MKHLDIKGYSKRLIFVLFFLLFLVLFMDFNARVSNLFRKNELRDKNQLEIYDLEQTKSALQTRVAYATSDVAVEEWARQYGHLGRPSDVPVVLVPLANVTPTPATLPTPTAVTIVNYQVWWALFFGR